MNKCEICNKEVSVLDTLNFNGKEYYVHDGNCQKELLKKLEKNKVILNDIEKENIELKKNSIINIPNTKINIEKRPFIPRNKLNNNVERQLLSIQLVSKSEILKFRNIAKSLYKSQNQLFSEIIKLIYDFNENKNEKIFLENIKNILNIN